MQFTKFNRKELTEKTLQGIDDCINPTTLAGSSFISEEMALLDMLANGAKYIYAYDTGYTYTTYQDFSNKEFGDMEKELSEDREYNRISYILEIGD